MNGKKRIIAAAIAALTMLLSACSSSSKLTLAASGADSEYYDLGSAMAYYIEQDEDAELTLTLAETSGSVANIQGVSTGKYRLGIVQADLLSCAWNGTGAFADGAVQSIRAVAELYTRSVQLVTLDSALDSVSDLAGHIVSVGAEGDDTYWSAMDVLSAAGLNGVVVPEEALTEAIAALTESEADAETTEQTESTSSEDSTEDTSEDAENSSGYTSADVLAAVGLSSTDVALVYMDNAAGTDALQIGTIDAMFVVGSAPVSALTELCAENDVTFISLDSSTLQALTEANPCYSSYALAKSTYSGQTTAVSTVSVKAILIASAEADEDTVHSLTKIIFENTSNISGKSDFGSELSIAGAVSGVDIPYHTGAARYFAEQGYSVATE